MNYVLGKNGKLYYGTALAPANSLEATIQAASLAAIATGTEFDNIQDVDSNMQKDTVEINSRANRGWKQKVGTLKDATITFKILWKPADANFQAFRDAWLNDTEIACWCLDGAKDVEGSQGLAGNFNVVNFSRSEPIGDAMTAQVELTPSSFTHYFEVEAGS